MEVIAQAGFSLDATKDESTVYLTALKQMLRIPGNPVALLPYGADLLEFLNKGSLGRVAELLDRTVNARLDESLAVKAEDNSDLLDLVIASSKADPSTPLEEQRAWIRDQVQLLFIGGSDTSSVALSWCFICLAAYPSVQAKVRSEVHAALSEPKSPDALFAAINEGLRYTEAFIKEILRFWAPFASSPRQLPKGETEFAGVSVPDPTRTQVVYFGNLASFKEENFPQAEEFLPERWLDNRWDAQAFSAFSYGFRSCLGKNFAMLEMKTVLALVLDRHRVVPLKDDQGFPKQGMTGQVAGPIDPYPLRLVRD
jgi:cytochrome P450